MSECKHGYLARCVHCELAEAYDRIEELESALRKIEQINFGYDGDCGVLRIVSEVLDD